MLTQSTSIASHLHHGSNSRASDAPSIPSLHSRRLLQLDHLGVSLLPALMASDTTVGGPGREQWVDGEHDGSVDGAGG